MLGGLLQACAATSVGPGSGSTRPTSAGGAPSSSGGPVVTLGHWDWWVSQTPWVEREIARFEKANPNIKIKRTLNATATYDQLFNLAERSQNAPDTFMITTKTVPLNGQVQKRWLLPVNKYAGSSWLEQFPQYSFVEGSNTFGGKIYTAPFGATAPSFQLYINNSVFRQAGLTNRDGSIKVPRTWDDITSAAGTIVKKSNGNTFGLGFGNSSFDILPWWYEVMVRAAGSPMGGFPGPNMKTGTFNTGSDRNYVDLMRLVMEWKQRGYFYPDSISISDEISRAYFSRGKFGMTVGGVWNEPEWTDAGFTDYTLTTLVGPDTRHRGYFYSAPGGTLLAINANTRYPEQAWKWFQWWYGVSAGKDWTQVYHEDLSAHTEDDNAAAIKFKPFSQYVALRQLAIPGPQPWVKNPDQAFVVVNPVTPNFGNILTGMYTGQIKDLQSAFSDLDGRMQEALDAGIQNAKQQGYKVSLQDFHFPDWDLTRPYKWTIPKTPKMSAA